jgi:hypothetical protein
MFKKIEIWILYLVIVFSLLFSFVPSIILQIYYAHDKKIPGLTTTIQFISDLPVKIADLIFLRENGVIVSEKGKPWRYNEKIISALRNSNHNAIGRNHTKSMYLLSSGYDVKLEKVVIDIINLNTFEVEHKIVPNYEEIKKHLNPYIIYTKAAKKGTRHLNAMAPLITPDGGIVFQAKALVKIKSNGEIDWVNGEKEFHHSINIDSNGNIWAPTRNYPFTLKGIKSEKSFFEDAITCVSPDGDIIFDRSLVDILFNNNMADKLFINHGFKRLKMNPMHLNDIEPVFEDGKYWKKGDLFLSLRHLSMVLLYRPSNDSIVWYNKGTLNQQHDVDIISGNEISIFNNNIFVYKDNKRVKSNNKITIYNFDTNQFRSYNKEGFDKYKIRTATQGLHTLLKSGELYVEETDKGRHLFFDYDGNLVWEIFNYSKDKNLFYKYNWSTLVHKESEIKQIQQFLDKQ